MPYGNASIPQILGLNQDENPDSLATGELVEAQNVGRFGNMVGTRPGAAPLASSADYENALTGTPVIRGAHEYRKNFDEGRALIVIAENPGAGTFPAQKIWYQDDARLDDSVVPTITHGSDYIYSMGTHANVLYATGGPPGQASAVTEDMWKWDGDSTTPSAPEVVTLTDKGTGATLRPKFVKPWRNFLLINGLQQTDANRTASNNPSVTRYATFGADPGNDASWPDSKTVGFNATRVGLDSYGENFSTGFGEYTDNRGDFLLLLSNRQIAAAQGTVGQDFAVTDTIANGCVHQRAFVNPGLDFGDAVYVGPRGVHSLRQSQEHGDNDKAFLSWKIRPFWNSLKRSRLHFTCAAASHELGIIVFAFSTSAQSGEGHNVLMVLDIRDPETLTGRNAIWYGPWILGGGIKVNHLMTVREVDESYALYLFTTEGRVLKFDETVHADLTSNGYSVIMETKPESFGSVLTEKRLGDTAVTIGTSAGGAYGVSMRTIVDFGRGSSSAKTVQVPDIGGAVVGSSSVGNTAKIGSGFAITGRKVYTSGRGYALGYRFSHSGTNEPFFLGRIDQQVAIAGEDSSSGGSE